MLAFFRTIISEPLYNILVFLTVIIPTNQVGWAIIILTLLVRSLLFPFQHNASKTQAKVKELDPEIKRIKEECKDDKQQQAQKTMELYKEHGINPFTGIIMILIQLPIILSLFFLFYQGFSLDTSILYDFTPYPDDVNLKFLGFININESNIFLAVLVGITQFIQMKLAMPVIDNKKALGQGSFKEDFGKSLSLQMKYVMPIMIAFIASSLPAAVSLYWLTSNTFTVGHEVLVKKQAYKLGILKKNKTETEEQKEIKETD